LGQQSRAFSRKPDGNAGNLIQYDVVVMNPPFGLRIPGTAKRYPAWLDMLDNCYFVVFITPD
jgi:23S rRNA G2445 N2-methylase RlmL